MKEEVYVWEVPFAADDGVREKFVKDVKKLLAKYDDRAGRSFRATVQHPGAGRRSSCPSGIYIGTER